MPLHWAHGTHMTQPPTRCVPALSVSMAVHQSPKPLGAPKDTLPHYFQKSISCACCVCGPQERKRQLVSATLSEGRDAAAGGNKLTMDDLKFLFYDAPAPVPAQQPSRAGQGTVTNAASGAGQRKGGEEGQGGAVATTVAVAVAAGASLASVTGGGTA